MRLMQHGGAQGRARAHTAAAIQVSLPPIFLDEKRTGNIPIRLMAVVVVVCICSRGDCTCALGCALEASRSRPAQAVNTAPAHLAKPMQLPRPQFEHCGAVVLPADAVLCKVGPGRRQVAAGHPAARRQPRRLCRLLRARRVHAAGHGCWRTWLLTGPKWDKC